MNNRTRTTFEFDDQTITATGIVLNEYETTDIEWTSEDEEYEYSLAEESVLLDRAEEALLEQWIVDQEESDSSGILELEF